MMGKPKLLDMYCGGGGAAVGYDRAGFEVTGPAVIEEPNSTTLVFPGDRARISAHGHIIIDIDLPQGVLA